MKKPLSLLLAALLLTGCSAAPVEPVVTEPSEQETLPSPSADTTLMAEEIDDIPFLSQFDSETAITLAGSTVSAESDAVYISHDIVYYEDRDSYDSGNPYGEGESSEHHTAEEAAAHTVVNITSPGRYRVTGTLDLGQLRVDLGDEAYADPNARVELILDHADITCTVGPAVLFLNVYECDEDWSVDTASEQVDTIDAGAVLILENNNRVSGSHVARIFKDQPEEKKLWKMDGAIYSFMSMEVYGPGSLDLAADNEGLDTELHLTINGGNIAIRSDNDGINTNEDGVSVTTINGGNLHIIAGLGAEGDGIDSNGYLVINGGTVVAAANPAADAGLDSDLGSYINGGTVIALGSTMDWAESDSDQVTMNLQFAGQQSSGDALVVTQADGTVLFAYDPSDDEILGANARRFQGAVISSPNFQVGESYHLYLGGVVSGPDSGGIYDVTAVTGYENGIRQCYTGSDLQMRPGGMGGGEMPSGGWESGEHPEPPDGWSDGERTSGDRPEPPEGFDKKEQPDGRQPPEGRKDSEVPQLPENWPDGEMPQDSFPGVNSQSGDGDSLFLMQDKVNAFTGIRSE